MELFQKFIRFGGATRPYDLKQLVTFHTVSHVTFLVSSGKFTGGLDFSGGRCFSFRGRFFIQTFGCDPHLAASTLPKCAPSTHPPGRIGLRNSRGEQFNIVTTGSTTTGLLELLLPWQFYLTCDLFFGLLLLRGLLIEVLRVLVVCKKKAFITTYTSICK